MEVALAQEEVASQGEAAAQEEAPKPKKRRKRTKREDVIVTARVPLEIRNQAVAVLESIGSTPTELINAAFEYVIFTGELPPVTPSLEEMSHTTRRATPEQMAKINERIERTTFAVPDSFWAGKTDEELLGEALEEKYGPLA